MAAPNAILLRLQLFDGATNKFVQSYLFDQDGASLSTPSVNLSHIGDGCYIDNSVFFPGGATQVIAVYRVFNDSGYTQRSKIHSDAIDTFDLPGGTMTEIVITNQNVVTGKIEPLNIIFGKMELPPVVGRLDPVKTVSGTLEQEQDLEC